MRPLICLLLLAGCLEVVDHTPPAPEGTCARDGDCPCGQDCSIADGGFHFCGPRVTHGCMQHHECQVQDAGHCLELLRDGGGCGYLVCR